MTTENELDRVLALELMGWHVNGNGSWWAPDEKGKLRYRGKLNSWHPTTDIAQAMMVAQKISDKGWIVLTLTYEHHEGVPQGCVITRGCAAPFQLPEIVKYPTYFKDAIFQQAETLPLAICLAAQAWLEAKTELDGR